MNLLLSLALALVIQGTFIDEGPGRIGIRWSPITQDIAVVHPSSPAERAGLKKGDHIVSWTGKDISGPAYTPVIITVKRGRDLLSFIIIREPYNR